METKIPKSKYERGLESGKIAVKVGGKVLKYLTRRPFMSTKEQIREKTALDKENADLLFNGLSLLKGTALKIAQQLSLELDLFPEEIRKELEKSYHQVPPLNRALIRSVVTNTFGHPPEKLFRSFNTRAFAAASLGQVHQATAPDGSPLAVKIQYPGIDTTISGDIQLLKNIFRPLPEYDLIKPALAEIETRLLEEVDYKKEAVNLNFFRKNLLPDRIHIPSVLPELSNTIILSETFVEGLPLDQWIETDPGQTDRDAVAQTLNEIFFTSLYELNCIHADPNPGNFIIREDGMVGLIDFGCVKRLAPDFVSHYRKFAKTVTETDKRRYFHLLEQLQIIAPDLNESIKTRFYKTMSDISQWFSRLFVNEYFDFGKNQDFLSQGRKFTNDLYKLRKYVEMNPEFVFLDRTRYGLLRIYEKLGARVKMRNKYEFE